MTAVEICWEINIALILQKYPLKNVPVNTWETSNTSNTETSLIHQNIYGNWKMLIYHQLLCGVLVVLLQKYYQKHKIIAFFLSYTNLRNSI